MSGMTVYDYCLHSLSVTGLIIGRSPSLPPPSPPPSLPPFPPHSPLPIPFPLPLLTSPPTPSPSLPPLLPPPHISSYAQAFNTTATEHSPNLCSGARAGRSWNILVGAKAYSYRSWRRSRWKKILEPNINGPAPQHWSECSIRPKKLSNGCKKSKYATLFSDLDFFKRL